MTGKFINLIFIFFIFTGGLVFGDEVTSYGSEQFMTEEMLSESSAISGERILLHASTSLSGKLEIMADTVDSAILEYRKIVKTISRAKATEYTELTDVTIRKTHRGHEILFRTSNPAPWSGSDEAVTIEGKLRLPEDCQLKIEAIYFDLDISGPFISVENDKTFGRLDISNVSKVLDLSGSNRDINLKNISGDVIVNLSHADVWIEDMKAEYRPARISNEYGNISIDRFEGDFKVENSYGRIKLTNMTLTNGKSSIEGVQCPIRISARNFADAELFVSDSYEDIILELPDSVVADFFLKTENDGEIHVHGIPVKPMVIESNYVELRSGGGDSKIRIGADGGGNINVYGYSDNSP